MSEGTRAVIAIVSSIIGLSIVAVVLSARANTAGVVGAASSGLAGVLSAATAPVTGAGAGVPYGLSSNLGAGIGQSLLSGALYGGGNYGMVG